MPMIRARVFMFSSWDVGGGFESLRKQRAARLYLACAQRDVARMVEDRLLALAAQDEAQELLERRRERLAGRLVGVEEGKARKRIGRRGHVLVGRRLERAA